MQLRARQSVTLSETQNQQMTGFLPAAFVAAPAATRVLPPATSLQVVKSAVVQAVVHDCTKDALSFFTGIRTPSALIAGSSLAALFSMIKKYRDPNKTKAEKVTLRLFHACALFGYLLSVTTVIVSTAASTTLLLGGFNSKADSVYHFLKREMNFEFVLTRWCFFMGVLNFLVAMGGRVLIEFDLFAEYRKAERYVVFLALGGMIGHLISVINSSLNCWPNLFGMTLDVIQMTAKRAFDNSHPVAILSVAGATTALSLATYTMVREVTQPEDMSVLSDTDGADTSSDAQSETEKVGSLMETNGDAPAKA